MDIKETFVKEFGVTVDELRVLYNTVKKSGKVPTKGISFKVYELINKKYNFKDVSEFIELYKSLITETYGRLEKLVVYCD